MITKSLSIILLVQLIGHITSIQHIHDINEVQNNSSLHLNKTSSSLLNEFSINSQNLTQWEELSVENNTSSVLRTIFNSTIDENNFGVFNETFSSTSLPVLELNNTTFEDSFKVLPSFLNSSNSSQQLGEGFSTENSTESVIISAVTNGYNQKLLNSTIELVPELNKTTAIQSYELLSGFKIVFIEKSNSSRPLEKLSGIEQLIKHSILKYFGGEIDQVLVRLSTNYTRLVFDSIWTTRAQLPIHFDVFIKTPIQVNEEQFKKSIIEYSINRNKCIFSKNETQITCSTHKTKNAASALRLSDYWVELDNLLPTQERLDGLDTEMFTYKPAWIIGLTVIGCIIAIFFFGCIIAICYTRRPYRRCGKVYDIDSVAKKNNLIPQIPGAYPSTKTSALTKTKEMYYQQ